MCRNVQWYVTKLLEVCRHITWIQTTAPATDNYDQKSDRILIWNTKVYELLSSEFATRTSVVDVYNTSTRVIHEDNVHMHSSFYFNLARFVDFGMVRLK
eukprot:COSAG05_NODE_4750_length_1386_cov_3.205905_2_plen_99_part_00